MHHQSRIFEQDKCMTKLIELGNQVLLPDSELRKTQYIHKYLPQTLSTYRIMRRFELDLNENNICT